MVASSEHFGCLNKGSEFQASMNISLGFTMDCTVHTDWSLKVHTNKLSDPQNSDQQSQVSEFEPTFESNLNGGVLIQSKVIVELKPLSWSIEIAIESECLDDLCPWKPEKHSVPVDPSIGKSNRVMEGYLTDLHSNEDECWDQQIEFLNPRNQYQCWTCGLR